jgi:hypothetical protein
VEAEVVKAEAVTMVIEVEEEVEEDVAEEASVTLSSRTREMKTRLAPCPRTSSFLPTKTKVPVVEEEAEEEEEVIAMEIVEITAAAEIVRIISLVMPRIDRTDPTR